MVTWWERVIELESGSFQWCPVTMHKETGTQYFFFFLQEMLTKHKEKGVCLFFKCVCLQAVGQRGPFLPQQFCASEHVGEEAAS